MVTCDRCGAPAPDDAKFCPACGAPLARGSGVTQALKTVTILFTDMVESTALGERFDPESLHAVMNEYFSTIRSVVERYGGSVEKFIGDAVMAVFGIPELHEDDAHRAVSAAAAIHRAIVDLDKRLERDAGVFIEVRTGVNTGEVLSQMSGESPGGLVGDVVNVAARLQQTAAPGTILLGPSTYALVKDRVLTEALDPVEVRGRSAAIAAHRLIEVLPVTAPGLHGRRPTPLVGRAREVRLLRDTLERVIEDRAPHLFTVLGAPGVGKSRLVSELTSDGTARVLTGRCLPYGEGITYWPLVEIVQEAAGIGSEDTPEAARSKVNASLAGDVDAAAIADRISQLVGLSAAGGTTEELFWAVRKYFESLAKSAPLVVVLDDLHWAEPTMIELVDYVVDSIGDVPLLVVCLARLELLEIEPGWGGGKLNASSLVLGSLKEPDCEILLEGLLGDSPSIGAVADAVYRVADGNPLFVEEMVSMLIDDGLLQKKNGRWTAVRELASISVPATIQALVSARLDRLSSEEREVVGMAAVMGKVFASQALADLAGAGATKRMDDVLDGLTRKHLVSPTELDFAGGRTYSFRHILIRDTAYDHLPRSTRASLHEGYANWLVRVLGERLAEYDEIVGYHLEQAHGYLSQLGSLGGNRADLAKRAAERLVEGGRRATDREDFLAAVKLLSRAAALYETEAPERRELLSELGLALYEAGEYFESGTVLDEALDLASKAGDRRIEARCRLYRELVRIHRDPQVTTEESLRVAEECIPVLTELGDDLGLSFAWDLAAYSHDSAGRSTEALAALGAAIEHAEKAGDVFRIAKVKRALVRSISWGPCPAEEVIEKAEDLLRWAQGHNDRWSEARALLSLAQAHAMRGNFDRARGYVSRHKEVCAEVSLEFLRAWGAFECADVELLAGNVEEAERELQEACAFLERKGEKATLATLFALLGDVLHRRGKLDEAEATVERSRSLSSVDDSLSEMRWRVVLAKVLADRGDLQRAVELAGEAASVAAVTECTDWHAGIVLDLGDILERAGRPVDAARAFEEAAALYSSKGNLVRGHLAKERLTALSSS